MHNRESRLVILVCVIRTAFIRDGKIGDVPPDCDTRGGIR